MPKCDFNKVASCPEVFLGKGALKICGKPTGEHPCRSVISIKAAFASTFFTNTRKI